MEKEQKPAKPCDDGGYTSRKFWLTLLAIFLISGTALFAASRAGFSVLYSEMVMGVLGALGIYSGVNVWAKMATRKKTLKRKRAQTKE